MAGFLSYGSGKALSYVHDYGKDMDRLYQREAYKMQVQAAKEQKSAYYASLMKEHTAATEHNQKRLEDYYIGLTGQIADFAMKHPGWERDVLQSQKMYSLMDKFINNDIVREDIQVQQEWEKAKQAYGSQQISQSEYEENAARYDEYRNNGGDPFVFANPKRKEMSDILKSINDQLQGEQFDYTDPKTGKITRTVKTSDSDISLAAIASLADPEVRRAVEAEYNAVPEKERGAFKSMTDYFMQRIKAGEDFKRMDGGYDALYMKQMEKAMEGDSYQRSYIPNVYEPLRRHREVRPHDALLSFSSYAQVGNIIALDNTNKPFKAYNKDGNLDDLKIIASTKAIGSAGMKMVGGVPYVGTTIQVLIDPDEESPLQAGAADTELTDEEKRLSPYKRRKIRKEKEAAATLAASHKRRMIQDLEDHDFTLSYAYEEGLTSGIQGGVRKSAVYIGTVWEPAVFNETSRKQYDMTYTGQNKAVLDYSHMYDEDMNVLELISSGNINVLNSYLDYKPSTRNPQYENAEYNDPVSGKTFLFRRDRQTGKVSVSYE